MVSSGVPGKQVAALLLWGACSSPPRVTRAVTRSLRYPVLGRNVTADFQEKIWDDGPLEVSRCTAFRPPTAITCGRLCLRLGKLPLPMEARP